MRSSHSSGSNSGSWSFVVLPLLLLLIEEEEQEEEDCSTSIEGKFSSISLTASGDSFGPVILSISRISFATRTFLTISGCPNTFREVAGQSLQSVIRD